MLYILQDTTSLIKVPRQSRQEKIQHFMDQIRIIFNTKIGCGVDNYCLRTCVYLLPLR